MLRHTISIWVNDQPGVLQRISGLFGRRGYNIESITVGGSEQEGLSRMILVTRGDEAAAEQICKQLNKLIDVIRIVRLEERPMLARELMLIKIQAQPDKRPEIFGLIETFRCSVIDIGANTCVVQAVGDADKNNAIIQLLHPYGIVELSRTGETAMNRGDGTAGTGI